jgi:hypothetical protein
MCRRCSDCIGEEHHWIEACAYPDTEDPVEIDMLANGVEVGVSCKHCPTWAESDDDGNAVRPYHAVVGEE